MCITFSREQLECDIVSHLLNLAGNAAVTVVGGTALASIAYVALNALGYETITAAALCTVVPYIPVSLAAFGAPALLGGLFASAAAVALLTYLAAKLYNHAMKETVA